MKYLTLSEPSRYCQFDLPVEMKEFFQKSRLKISSFLGCVLYIGTAGGFFSTGVHIIQMIVIYDTSHIENVDYNRIW